MVVVGAAALPIIMNGGQLPVVTGAGVGAAGLRYWQQNPRRAARRPVIVFSPERDAQTQGPRLGRTRRGRAGKKNSLGLDAESKNQHGTRQEQQHQYDL